VVTLLMPMIIDENYRKQKSLSSLVMLSHGSYRLLAFVIVKQMFFYLISAWVASDREEKYMDTAARHVPLLFVPWFWVRQKAMSALPSPTAPWAIWTPAEVLLDPYHLMGTERFFDFPVPTRSCFCSFEALLGYLAVLWIFLLCFTKHNHISNERQSEVEELVKTIQNTEDKSQLSALTGFKRDLASVERRCPNAFSCGLKCVTFGSMTLETAGDYHSVVRHVQPVTFMSLWLEVTWFLVDMITDLWQVHNLYLNACHTWGGIMLCLFFGSITRQVLRCDYCILFKEMSRSAEDGVKTNTYIKIMRWEKGVEGFLNLMCNALILRSSMQTAPSLVVGVVGLFFSVVSYSMHLFQRSFLGSFYREQQRDFL